MKIWSTCLKATSVILRYHYFTAPHIRYSRLYISSYRFQHLRELKSPIPGDLLVFSISNIFFDCRFSSCDSSSLHLYSCPILIPPHPPELLRIIEARFSRIAASSNINSLFYLPLIYLLDGIHLSLVLSKLLKYFWSCLQHYLFAFDGAGKTRLLSSSF